MEMQVKAGQKPDGSRFFPAKTCHDLKMCHFSFESGYYWIDPNGGTKTDAIEVYCNFTTDAIVESCVWPRKSRFDHKELMKGNRNNKKWFFRDISSNLKMDFYA